LKNYSIRLLGTEPLSSQKIMIEGEGPLREIITGNFYDKLKSITQGYASFSFKPSGFREANLVKLDILIAGKKEEIFSKIVPREKAFSESKQILQKLKNFLPPQQFPVALQGAIGGKIIARETIKALRKDVTAPLYGGDVTRKRKLLEKQKKGKQKLKERFQGRLRIPSEVFLKIFKS